jgi:tetratricopeptide (TPR) repeat protein
MIVVEPSASRFEASESSVSSDEHLLERISATENRITRLAERLERSLDLLLRQAQTSYFDRSLLKALIELLSEDGLLQSDRLEQIWNKRCTEDAAAQEESLQRGKLRSRILSRAPIAQREAFERLIVDAFRLIDDRQHSKALDLLKQAAEMSPDDLELTLFIGQHLFRTGKSKSARLYLERVLEAKPDDEHVAMLLGLTCADIGEVSTAINLLTSATKKSPSFAGHYGLGWLFFSENKLTKALREFKRALSVRPSPEAHYVLGCFYYQTERHQLATRHLRKAIEMDMSFSEALDLLAIIYQQDGQAGLAEETLAKMPQSRAASEHAKVSHLFQSHSSRRKTLMSGTGRRLKQILREEALKAFVSLNN